MRRLLAAAVAGSVAVGVLGCSGDAVPVDGASPGPRPDAATATAVDAAGRTRAALAQVLLEEAHLIADAARASRRGESIDAVVEALEARTDELAALLVPTVEPGPAEAFRAAWMSDTFVVLDAVTGGDPAALAARPELDERCAATVDALDLDTLSGLDAAEAMCDQRRTLLDAADALENRPQEATGLFVTAGRQAAALAEALTPTVNEAGELLVGLTTLLTEHVVLVVRRAELDRAGDATGVLDDALDQNAAALHRRLEVAVGDSDDFEVRWGELVASYQGAGPPGRRSVEAAHEELAQYLRRVLAGYTEAEIVANLWPDGDRLAAAVVAAGDASPLTFTLRSAAVEEAGAAADFLTTSVARQYPDEF